MAGRPFLPWFVAALLVDQGIKSAVRTVAEGLPSVGFGPARLGLCLVWNPGAAFSSWATSPARHAFFATVTLVTLGVLSWAQVHHGVRRPDLARGLALLGGGAAGNFADRLLYQEVTDCFCVRWGSRWWPAFNPADLCIAAGVVLAVLALMLDERVEGSPPEP